MADMTRIKGRIAETIYPNGTGAITAESHQALLLEMVDDINMKKADQSELIATKESLNALEQKVDNLPQGEEFDKQGNYPLLHVGTADDLAGRGESVPAEFGFRASGGKSIKDGRAYIKRIKGNSVVWNQLKYNGDFSKGAANWYVMNNNSFSVDNGVATIKLESDPQYEYWAYLTYDSFPFEPNLVLGHKYLFKAEIWLPKPADVIISASKVTMTNNRLSSQPSNIWFLAGAIGEATESKKQGFAVYPQQIKAGYVSGDIWRIRNTGIYDLTQMFGAGNEPTTIEEFYARVATLGVDMNAYNEGQVIHCNTESIKSVGDNAWDEEWESGSFSITDGTNVQGDWAIRNKNYIKVLPKQEYYFKMPTSYRFVFYDEQKNYISGDGKSTNQAITIPSNCHYLKFSVGSTVNPITTYNNDIMITLVHSGWKQDTDAGYQPYWQDILPLPIIRKYFPDGMKKAGTAHDEIRFNKVTQKWEMVQRMGQVNAWELTWNYMGISESNPYGRFSTAVSGRQINKGNILCTIYTTQGASYTTDKNIFGASSANTIIVIDSAYTDVASFTAMLQEKQVVLYYELAKPIVTELDAEDQNFRDYYNVADFGTEMSQSSVPSAPFSADIIYQFNAVDMIREHELEITELQSIITEQQSVIATMQAQLTSLINGGQ